MKTKFFFPFCAMIALPSVANAIPAFLNNPESQTAMAPLCADNQLAANVFKAMPVEEAQTASFWLTSPEADAEDQTAAVWLASPEALKNATETQTAEALHKESGVLKNNMVPLKNLNDNDMAYVHETNLPKYIFKENPSLKDIHKQWEQLKELKKS